MLPNAFRKIYIVIHFVEVEDVGLWYHQGLGQEFGLLCIIEIWIVQHRRDLSGIIVDLRDLLVDI